jgi:hypothetical protein
MNRATVALVLGVMLAGAGFAQKKPGIKGRYLELEPGSDLRAFMDALVVVEEAEIVADKDAPVDNEAVRLMSDEHLVQTLRGPGLFTKVVNSMPAALPTDRAVLRVTTKLTLQHGSQAMRFWVGAGAGKSKLHIRVTFFDASSGAKVAWFNGYGTGAGFSSPAGGGIQRMAGDDLRENYAELAKLLKQQLRPGG